MSTKIIKYIKKNTKRELTDLEISDYLEKPRTWSQGLSINEYVKLNPKNNERLVLKVLKEWYYLESILFEESAPKVKFEVGEIYYDSMVGLCVITRFFEADETKRGFYGCEIGRFEKLSIPGKSFTLYDNGRTKFRPVTDKDIHEYLLSELTMFSLGNSDTGDSCMLSVNEDSIYISGEEFVYLNKAQARKLKELLNREIS